MGQENEVYMDTKVFTGIVNSIGRAGSECVFLEDSRSRANAAWEGTDVGKEIIEILEQLHKTVKDYREETSEAFPKGFLTLRDGLLNVDERVSKSLDIDSIK